MRWKPARKFDPYAVQVRWALVKGDGHELVLSHMLREFDG